MIYQKWIQKVLYLLFIGVSTTISAEYSVTFESTWTQSTHPYNFPNNPHFSRLTGGLHDSTASFWMLGGTSSAGIENMAETGGQEPLLSEVQTAVDNSMASLVLSGGNLSSPGSTSFDFTITERYPLVSLVTMIAPSPDWFAGVSGLNLYENGQWAAEVVVPLYIFDAGTDDGIDYTSSNLDVTNKKPIDSLRSMHFLINNKLEPIGTFTFTRTSPVSVGDGLVGKSLGKVFGFYRDGIGVGFYMDFGKDEIENVELFTMSGKILRSEYSVQGNNQVKVFLNEKEKKSRSSLIFVRVTNSLGVVNVQKVTLP